MGWLRDTFGRRGAAAPALQAAGEPLARGKAQLEQGEFAAAAESLEQALAQAKRARDPQLHQLHYLLGRACAGAGRFAPASIHFESALAGDPDFADALEAGAAVLQELEEHDQAVEWLERLVRLRPVVAARLQLARGLRLANRLPEAAALLGPLCREAPRNVEAALLHHHVLMGLGRLEEALVEIDRAIGAAAPDVAMLVNRSVPLQYLGRHDEALASLARALKLEPTHPRALASRAAVLLSQLKVDDAIAAAEEGLRLHPEEADLHWSLATGLLLKGDMERGWAESEWRTRTTGFQGKVPELEQPRWQGEDLAGRTILLYAEQGMGDTIQFLRFVPEVAKRAKTVLLMVWPELESLVAQSLPANCRIVARRLPIAGVDFHCPLLSVPGVLGTTLATLPAQVPYLRAAPAAAQAWRDRLHGQGLKVGLCWSGNPRHANDRVRSMSLQVLRTVDTKGCSFYTLQPQRSAGDEAILGAWSALTDTGRELGDFADTAALVEALDLVITVDTAVAHLAGALGKPVWILLAHAPEWRWMLERTDSPWYPTAKLYRQRARGNWAQVLARVKADLAALAARPGG